jgi:hypothetical protein
MSAHHHRQNFAYSVPGSQAQEAARRVDSHHEPQHAAPQPAHSTLRRSLDRSTAGPRPKLPRHKRSESPSTQAEPEALTAPQDSLQVLVDHFQMSCNTPDDLSDNSRAGNFDVDTYAVLNTPAQQRTDSARTSRERGNYHRAHVIIDGRSYGPEGPTEEYEQACFHMEAREIERSTQGSALTGSEFEASDSEASESDCKESCGSSRTSYSKGQVVEAKSIILEDGRLKLTVANVQLNERIEAQDFLSNAKAIITNYLTLTPQQIRWVNKHGYKKHTKKVFDVLHATQTFVHLSTCCNALVTVVAIR